MKIRYAFAALLPAVTFAPAHAQSSESSGSVTIRLIVPPLGAAASAVRAGAVGSWTITTVNGGFMIRIPDEIPAGSASSVDIFAGEQTLFTADTATGAPITIGQSRSSDAGGLIRTQLELSPQPALGSTANGVPLFIRGV